MINIFHSNKLEILLNFLIDNFKKEEKEIFSEYNVVLQVSGLKKWLMFKIADALGIAACIKFYYPNTFINEILEINNENVLTGEELLFAITEIFLKNQDKYFKRFQIDNEYKLYKISALISDIFEQYFWFRPEITDTWKNKKRIFKNFEHEKWQMELFNEVISNTNKKTVPDVLKTFLIEVPENLKRGETFHFFAVSNLPPIHYKILKKISSCNNVFIYFLNPSQDLHWFATYHPETLDKIKIKTGLSPEKELYFTEGNVLLTSLSNICKNFLYSVSDIIQDPEGERQFEKFTDNSALGIIQNDILCNNTDLETISFENDMSIEIHSAHSEMREVEILFNRLLFFFEEEKSLMPEDIVVMAPDINIYAPYIKAVFNSRKPSIPYEIADTKLAEQDSFIQCFFKILDMKKSRFEFTKVFEILEYPFVKQNFSLSDSDIEMLKTWLYKSGVRWGKNKSFKEELGLTGFGENTWEFGIERLFLGFIFESEKTFSNIKPAPFVSGSEREKFAQFLKFFQLLSEFITEKLKDKKNLKEWRNIFSLLSEDMFYIDEKNENSYNILTNALTALDKINSVTLFSSDFVIEYLKDKVAYNKLSYNFLDKGVTFCEMIPMRSIPFKVICILGMNNENFPRKEKKTDFNIITEFPRYGDRNVKDNDKYLFLETVLSARDKLYISFIGKDIKNNEDKEPSVILSEFCDYLEKRFGEDYLKKISFHHKLHNFHPCYFKKECKFINYSKEDFKVAKASFFLENKAPFINLAKKNEFDQTLENIDISELVKFLKNPVKYFFNKKLNIFYEDELVAADDSEPFSIDALTEYKIISDTIIYDKKINMETLRYEGLLPHGNTGNINAEKINMEIYNLKKSAENVLNGKKYETVFEQVKINNDLSITGVLKTVFKEGQLFVYPAKEKGKHLIEAWIKHLFLSLLKTEAKEKFNQFPDTTFVIFKNGQRRFNKVENSGELLSEISLFFKQGQENPVDFHIEIAFETVRRMNKPRTFQLEKFLDEKIESLKEEIYFEKLILNKEKFLKNSIKIFQPLFENLLNQN